jgi:hypothetical protein
MSTHNSTNSLRLEGIYRNQMENAYKFAAIMMRNDDFYDNFPKEPIGGNNPYWRCSECKKSVPSINYRRSGHYQHCSHYSK